MPIVRFFGRLLNRAIQGIVAVAIVAVVGMLLDRVLLGDTPKGRPGRAETPSQPGSPES